MGFRKPDLEQAYAAIRSAMVEIRDSRNDGFTQMGCKQELYVLKCWLNDAYDDLPTFTGEEVWEQERIVQILKR